MSDKRSRATTGHQKGMIGSLLELGAHIFATPCKLCKDGREFLEFIGSNSPTTKFIDASIIILKNFVVLVLVTYLLYLFFLSIFNYNSKYYLCVVSLGVL